jgi:hypothetical protein
MASGVSVAISGHWIGLESVNRSIFGVSVVSQEATETRFGVKSPAN